MSLKEWLPITGRNRIALCLAGLSLVMFVAWNCFPIVDTREGAPTGIFASFLWREVLSPETYIEVVRSPNFNEFLNLATCIALILTGLVVLLAVPLWQALQASNYIRLPIALLNLSGGSVFVWHFSETSRNDSGTSWPVILTLMAVGMFGQAAAFFTFKNELALRDERSRL